MSSRLRVIVVLLGAAAFASSASRAHAQRPAAPAARADTGQTFRVNGAELHVETHGSGPPLVLLHGFMGCGSAWQPHLEPLAAKYRLIIPDLRGHGRSTNPGPTFTHRQAAQDLFALLDQMGITSFKAMGISSGGMTLLHAATSQPDRIEAMVLIGATSYFPEQARAVQRRLASGAPLPADARAQFLQCAARGEPQVDELLRTFIGFKDSYDDMNFTPPFLTRVKARTFIVHGDRDMFFPVEIPVEEYKAIPRSYLWIVPNGDHVPIYGPRAATFQAEALAFLAGDWERR